MAGFFALLVGFPLGSGFISEMREALFHTGEPSLVGRTLITARCPCRRAALRVSRGACTGHVQEGYTYPGRLGGLLTTVCLPCDGVRVNVVNVLLWAQGGHLGVPFLLFPFHCWRTLLPLMIININVRKAVPGP